MSELLSDLTGIFANRAVEKRIELLLDVEPETPLAVVGDALRLRQILTNLVGNALKLTNEDGIITIGVAAQDPNTNGTEDFPMPIG